MIVVNKEQFLLSKGNYSYCFYAREGKLFHAYFGARTNGFFSNCLEKPELPCFEFSEYGRGDFRAPSIVARTNESLSTDFRFKGYEILKQKPTFVMPSLRNGGETLAVYLEDGLLGLRLILYYTPYDEGLCRRAKLVNFGDKELVIEKFASSCFEFPAGDYEYLSLDGSHNNERNYRREEVSYGLRSIRSARGISSHQQSPFMALLQSDTTEENGEVYGFNFVYSGNFAIDIEKDEISQTRVCIGENIQYGGITLAAKEEFSTPETVAVYSANGLGEMSRLFHRLYRKHLLSPKYADKIRPIVINSWESVIYDISEKVLFEFIESAKGLGIDMVVLDDGWFGCRDNDDCSLGDWVVDTRKLPNGLTSIIQKCHDCGMRFGIWFEPEGISPDSDLYRAHPDWAIHTCDREGVLIRNQLTLDFSRKEVIDYVFESISSILKNNAIDYIKWDMNRPLTDVPNAKKYHDYVLGVYDLYERLTTAFPSVLIEGCASGGGRFDPAILYYSPMIWTSDNTDAWSRAKIQYSTSLCYPLQTLSNHVSACPNIQTGRTISFETRGAVASFGTLGYELHTMKLTKEERELVAEQTATYKKDASLILSGDLYRLRNPHTDGAFCQFVVSEDKTAGIFVYVREKSQVNGYKEQRVCLRGLDLDTRYRIEELQTEYSGRDLMNGGIVFGLPKGDYQSIVLHVVKVEEVRNNRKE